MTNESTKENIQTTAKTSDFNVLCVNDTDVLGPKFYHPNGPIEKGKVYRMIGVCPNSGGWRILGFPTFYIPQNKETGCEPARFIVLNP